MYSNHNIAQAFISTPLSSLSGKLSEQEDNVTVTYLSFSPPVFGLARDHSGTLRVRLRRRCEW